MRFARLSILVIFLLPISLAQISPQIDLSRIDSCVAPCAIFFDATRTSHSNNSIDTYHDLYYEWDFGDSEAGTWENGVGNKNKNRGFGPVTAHVFDPSPGSGTQQYTVELTVRDTLGSPPTSRNVTITVTDPEEAFSGNKTYCFSTTQDPNTGNWSGCPAGANKVKQSNFNTAIGQCENDSTINARRCLFRKGETFTGTGWGLNKAGPGLIGAYGTGSNPPVLKFTNIGGKSFTFSSPARDWRIQDVKFHGPGGAQSKIFSASSQVFDILVYNTTNTHDTYNNGFGFTGTALDSGGDDLHEGIFIVENDWEDFGQGSGAGGNINFIAASELAILGNRYYDSQDGEHVVRIAHGEQVVISHNDVGGSAQNKATFTLRSRDNTPGVTCSAGCGRRSEEFVVSDNHIRGSDSNPFTFTGQGSSGQMGRGRNFLVERNFIHQDTGENWGLQTGINSKQTIGVTIRNNILVMINWQNYGGIRNSSSDATIVNNTCYIGTSNSVGQCINPGSAKSYNNLLYAPEVNNPEVVNNFTGTLDSFGNMLASNNPFMGPLTISSPNNFELKDNSQALNTGVDMQLTIYDFGLTDRPQDGKWDIGAFEGEGTPPICGDGSCNGSETCHTCLQDCGNCPTCGDGTCNDSETCTSCEQDCGECPPPVCDNDGTCEAGENTSNCPNDCPPPAGGLVAHYKFETNASDASGNGNNGTINGATFSTGKIGNALSFNGTSDYVSIPTQSMDQVSIAAWVRADGFGNGTYPRIVEMPAYKFYFRNDNMSLSLRAARSPNDARWRTNEDILTFDSIWYHVAVTYDSTSTSNDPVFYINGSVIPVTENVVPAGTKIDNAGTGNIGRSINENQQWHGAIDELRIYDKILSAQEVGALFVEGASISEGDLNDDKVVDIFDLVIIGKSFNRSQGEQGFDSRADTNRNGTVGVEDLVPVAQNFGNMY